MDSMTIESDLSDLDEEEEIPFQYTISSYGADFPVDGLVKRINSGDIHIPSFQRSYVWKIDKASRFVESLLLGLPVPGIFLSKEQETNKLLVIDGQQRLRTLQYFYNGIFEPTKTEFALCGVQRQFKGKIYKKLEDGDRRLLDDSILHATVIKQDVPEDDSSIYHIFKRLNTGGELLEPQEIRASIYHGGFSDLLNQLNENPSWRTIYGKKDSRMRDQEVILRFLAFYFYYENYGKPMKIFLNKYMRKNREFELQSSEEISKLFTVTIELIYKCLGSRAFKPIRGLNAAVFDAVMIGVARRLNRGGLRDIDNLKEKYESLLKDNDFLNATSKGGTLSEKNVRFRIKLAIEAFNDLI
jgi:uncharacterized protein with ParB-like and HNH nuclease domain